MTQPGTPTNQRALGRPVLQTVGDFGNFLAWTGASPYNHPNIGFTQTGYAFPANFLAAASSNYGPSLLLNSLMTQGVVVWADASTGVLNYNTVSPGSIASNNWSFDSATGTNANPNAAVGTIPNSSAAGSPATVLSLLGGQPVVSVLWQDKAQNSLVAWQASIFGGSAGTAPFTLGHSCIDAPTVKSGPGGLTYLAYFDATTKNFSLATSRRNSVDFDFSTLFSTNAISSSYAPALVPLNGELAYVIWTGSNGTLAYQQIAIDAQGNWQVNTTSGCSGTIDGAVSTSAPSANLVYNVIDGVTTAQIAVAWQQSNNANSVSVYTFTPSFTPIYGAVAGEIPSV